MTSSTRKRDATNSRFGAGRTESARIRRAAFGPTAALINTEASTKVGCLAVAIGHVSATPARQFLFQLFFARQHFTSVFNFAAYLDEVAPQFRHGFKIEIRRNLSAPHGWLLALVGRNDELAGHLQFAEMLPRHKVVVTVSFRAMTLADHYKCSNRRYPLLDSK